MVRARRCQRFCGQRFAPTHSSGTCESLQADFRLRVGRLFANLRQRAACADRIRDDLVVAGVVLVEILPVRARPRVISEARRYFAHRVDPVTRRANYFSPDEAAPTSRLWAVPNLSTDLDICGETKFFNYCNQSRRCGELAYRRAINGRAFEHVTPARNQSQILSNGPVLVPPSIGQHDESRLPVTPAQASCLVREAVPDWWIKVKSGCS